MSHLKWLIFFKLNNNRSIVKNKLIQLIHKDKSRMHALRVLHGLDLPCAYIAAGFIRNLVWDELHHYDQRTALNDIDVIYFAPNETLSEEKVYQHRLKIIAPEFNWQVKNQAYMHLKHHHLPYTSVLEAMRYWPEKETAIAVRINQQGQLELLIGFDVYSIFEGYISHNSVVPDSVFHERIVKKQWLIHWPKLKVR